MSWLLNCVHNRHTVRPSPLARAPVLCVGAVFNPFGIHLVSVDDKEFTCSLCFVSMSVSCAIQRPL